MTRWSSIAARDCLAEAPPWYLAWDIEGRGSNSDHQFRTLQEVTAEMTAWAKNGNLGHLLGAELSTILNEFNIPGAVVSMRVTNAQVVTCAAGFADLYGREPLSGDEQFYIYSVTKPLIAAVLLQLVERGQLSLDDPLVTHLPELPDILRDDRITIQRLLNHSAGLPDYGPMPQYAQAVRTNPGEPWSTEEFLARSLSRGLEYAPGEGWNYSNVGFLILKLLLEKLHGSSLRDVLHTEIVQPLGLTRTFVAESLKDTAHLSPGYSAFFTQTEQIEDISRVYHPGWVSHGVVISTAAELAQMVEAIVATDGVLLSPDLRAVMLESIVLPFEHPPFRQPAYGLGVMIDAASPYGPTAGHGGGGPGYSIAAFHFADVAGHGVTIAAIANSDRGDLGMRLAFTALDPMT